MPIFFIWISFACSITLVSLECWTWRILIFSSRLLISMALFSKSTDNSLLLTIPVCCLSFKLIFIIVSLWTLSLDCSSFSDVRLAVRSWSLIALTLFYSWIYCNFSRVWDKITTVEVILVLSLWSSSFLSSIFSFKVWFSIFNCSKSIKWRPSASCSFFLRIFSLLANLFLKAIFWSLYWWTS